MLLHEAVREARKAAGLSQKRLAELAGIQRRQLATLESGGNVTLNTIRKVIAQLPNLETFTIDSVPVTVDAKPRLPSEEDFIRVARELNVIADRVTKMAREGHYPWAGEFAIKEANRAVAEALKARGGREEGEEEGGESEDPGAS